MRALCAALAIIACSACSTYAAAESRMQTLHEAAAGEIGIRLLEAPVSRENDPRARMYIVDYLRPGIVIRRKLEVTNTSRQPQHVELYAAAASIIDDRFSVAPGRSPNELSQWIGLDNGSRDIPAGQSAVVEATIAVPRDASSGEQYAVIWAQVSSPPGASGEIRMVNRVGVRVYLDVGLGGEPASDFEILSLAAARTVDGTPEVLAKVRNTGGRALDMSGSLSLDDGPGSLSAGPFPANPGMTLAIGHEDELAVPLDKRLPNGPWTARLTLVSGEVTHTLEARLTFPARTGVSAPVKPQTDRYLVPLVILSGLLFLLLILLLYLWLRRWRYRREQRL